MNYKQLTFTPDPHTLEALECCDKMQAILDGIDDAVVDGIHVACTITKYTIHIEVDNFPVWDDQDNGGPLDAKVLLKRYQDYLATSLKKVKERLLK